MQRSTTKKTIKVLLIFALNIAIGLGMMATAQETTTGESKSISLKTLEDGKVKIKIVTKSGDDQLIFEKTYESHEDMKNDPELEEYGINASDFSFSKGQFSFGSQSGKVVIKRGSRATFFDEDDDHSVYFNFDFDSVESKLHPQFGSNGNAFMFGFDDDDFKLHQDSSRSFSFSFSDDDLGFNLDSLRASFKSGEDGDAYWMNGEEFENFEELKEALKGQFKDMDFNFDFGDMKRHGHEGEEGFRVISRVQVFVKSAKASDIEKVGADKMEDLKINDISFYPNPSDGRFTVDIRTGNDYLLQIKVVDPDGAIVFEKSDQQSSGEYSFDVDLSQKRKGIYLLQVIQNNSSLTKRIIIE